MWFQSALFGSRQWCKHEYEWWWPVDNTRTYSIAFSSSLYSSNLTRRLRPSPSLSLMSSSSLFLTSILLSVVWGKPVLVKIHIKEADIEKSAHRHFTGFEIVRLLNLQTQVLYYSKVTLFPKMENSAQGQIHLPLRMCLIQFQGRSMFTSKMGVTLFKGTRVLWNGNKYVHAVVELGKCVYIN